MKKWFSILLLGGIVLSLCGFRMGPQAASTTLEISVRLINVTGGVASFAGPAPSTKVDVYNQVDDTLIKSVATDTDGLAELTLDPTLALSAHGEYHLSLVIKEMEAGEVVCKPGEDCRVTAYKVNGLSANEDDGILVVRVMRSPGLVDPVQGIKVIARIADTTGYPGYRINAYTQEKIYDDPGVTCTSDAEGLCVFYISPSYRWEYWTVDGLSGYVALEVANEIGVDGMGIPALESRVTVWSVAVNDKGKLDDCAFHTAPENTTTTKGCTDKRNQVATAQALVTPDKAATAALNAAIAQASILSKDTADRFLDYQPDEQKVTELVGANASRSYDPATQVRIILTVQVVSNNGRNAYIKEPAVETTVELTRPDDPGSLLGACITNHLGECVSIIDRNQLERPNGFLEFRVIADGYDNGIMVCSVDQPCEHMAFTATRLTGKRDAVRVYILVESSDYTKPVPGITMINDIDNGGPYCISDQNGICPIYAEDNVIDPNDTEAERELVHARIYISSKYPWDANSFPPHDDRLMVYYLAITKTGGIDDCTFASPVEIDAYTIRSSRECTTKKKVYQTAVAGYTATPTVTNTPLATMTPTATEVPPTPTVTLTPTPEPGLFAGGGMTWVIPLGAVVIVLLGGGAWLFLRARKKGKTAS